MNTSEVVGGLVVARGLLLEEKGKFDGKGSKFYRKSAQLRDDF